MISKSPQSQSQTNYSLCLDVGNTNLYGGVFAGEELITSFRRDTTTGSAADEFGVFFRTVLRENGIDPSLVTKVGISSVVPSQVHSLRGAAVKYFNCEPFILRAGVKTGLKILMKNPPDVGADRIANSISAVKRYPQQNIIIVDFGTATTYCAISKNAEYLGGAIIPGIKISMESLESRTARLPRVEIVKPENALGRSTVESIQAGLYYSAVGCTREICQNLIRETFKNEKTIIIGTGGFSRMFEDAGLFDTILADLVLDGVRIAMELNTQSFGN
ncbi:type III pantothenate kinase [bacterium]|nr:type III pantothenate kinase [bacterium]